jgi:hypothetical protein
MLRLLSLSFLLSVAFNSIAQQSNTGETSLTPSSLRPNFPSKKEVSKRERIARTPKSTIDLQREYYERVEAVMKARKKMARLSEKPQYSNPMYFGHRRPPKKHSPEKMRFCKECGLRH